MFNAIQVLFRWKGRKGRRQRQRKKGIKICRIRSKI